MITGSPSLNPVLLPRRSGTRNICISRVTNKNVATDTRPTLTVIQEDSDLKFYSWFIGFCDAEGNFQTTNFKRVNKKGITTSIGLKYSFHIGLHLRDKNLLERRSSSN